MKKHLYTLVFFLLFIFVILTANAEPFLLRNGILFGDTPEIVKGKETSLSYSQTLKNNVTYKGTIAGHPDVECIFSFDDNKLVSMHYSFGEDICSSPNDSASIFGELRDSLCRKYGTPLGNKGGSIDVVTGPAFDRMSTWISMSKAFGYLFNCPDYDEWIIDCEDYKVKIDLFSYYYMAGSSYGCHVDVSYLMFSNEDVAQAQLEILREQASIDNDM